jgi:bacteriocin-like protein
MRGMKNLTKDELNLVKGGACNSDYGYYFCCPASKKILQENVKKYQKTDYEKAKKYIQFCYESCDI